MGAVIAGPGHRIRRPGRAGNGARRVDTFIGIDRRIGDGRKRRRMFHDAAEKRLALGRQTERHFPVGKGIDLAVEVPDRNMGMAAIAGQALERLRHEGGAQPVLFGDGFDHEFEEGMFVCGLQRVVIFPVHLELAVRVLMVILVGLPAQLQHVIANLGNDIITAHHRLLVVAGLFRRVVFVGDFRTIRRNQEKFRLHARLDPEPFARRLSDELFQHHARRLLHRLAFHHAIGSDPGDILFPRKLDDRGSVGHGKKIGMGGRQIEPGGEARKTRAILLHIGNRFCGNQLGALAAEEIGITDHEIFDALFGSKFGEVQCHVIPLFLNIRHFIEKRRAHPPKCARPFLWLKSCLCPGTSWFPPAEPAPWRQPPSSAPPDLPAPDCGDGSCRRHARWSAPRAS